MKSRSECFEKGPRGPSFRHLGFGLGLFLGRGVETKQRKKIDENSFILFQRSSIWRTTIRRILIWLNGKF